MQEGNVTAQSIATAKSQTQITDGFFVKDTHTLGETIEYLRLLTEVIIEAHQVSVIMLPRSFGLIELGIECGTARDSIPSHIS